MRGRSYVVAQLAALAAIASAPGAGAQDLQQTITTLDAAAPVAAYGNVIAWSQPDPVSGWFKLIVARGHSYHEVAAPAQPAPFDVDVGPGPSGKPWVVYSRCSDVAPYPVVRGLTALPDFTRGAGCRVHAWDVAAGRERTLHARGVLPSIWGRRLLYARGSRVLGGTLGSARERTLVRGLHGFRPAWIDAYRGHVTALWRRGSATQLADGRRIVARSTGRRRLLGLGWDRGVLFFRTTCVGATGNCPESYWAYRPASRRVFAAPASQDVVAAAHASGNTIALLGADNGSVQGCSAQQLCRLVIEDQLEFSTIPR